MQKINQDELKFDPAGVPPSQAEIGAYIESLRLQSKAAERKTNISTGISLFSAFGFIFALCAWLSIDPEIVAFAQDFLGPALLGGVLISAVCGYGFFAYYDLMHKVFDQKIDNSGTAPIEMLEELLDLITTTGIRPDYLTEVSAQERELTVSEVLNLKAHISKEHAARRRAETQIAIQTALGVPTRNGGSPSDKTDTNTGPIQA